MLRFLVAVGVWVAMGATVALPVAEAGTWSAPELVTSAGFSPRASTGADGTVVVAWVPALGSFGGKGLRIQTREPDGSKGPEQDLEVGRSTYFQVAVSGTGDAFVIWVTDGVVHAAVRPARGVFGPPQVLETGLTNPSIDIAADRAGGAMAVWTGRGGVTLARRRAGDPTFGAAETVAPGGQAQLAASDGGITGLAWTEGRVVKVARRSGAGFGAPETIGDALPHYSLSRFELAGHADGSLAVMLDALVEKDRSAVSRRWVATAPGDGAFRAPAEIDPGTSGDTAFGPSPSSASLGAVPGGRALIATEAVRWTATTGGASGSSEGLQLQTVGANGVPAAPTRAAGVSYANGPRVGVDRLGTAVAVFDSMDGTSAVSVPAGEAPCPARRIASHRSISSRPVLDTGEAGVVAWQEIPSSRVHLARHRSLAGCEAPPRQDPPPGPGADPGRGRDGSATGTTTGAGARPSGPPVSLPRPAAAAGVSAPRVGATGVVDRARRTAELRLTCASTTACSGRIELGAPARTSRAAARAQYGAARFSIPAGAARRVRVRLTSTARRALRRGPLRTRARVVADGGARRARLVTLRR